MSNCLACLDCCAVKYSEAQWPNAVAPWRNRAQILIIFFLRGNTKLPPEIYRIYHMEPCIISVFKYKSPIFLMEGKELYKTRDRKDLDTKVNFMVVSIVQVMLQWDVELFYTMLVLRSWRNPWLTPKVALVMDMSTLSLLTHTKASFCFTVLSWYFQQFATSSLLICHS